MRPLVFRNDWRRLRPPAIGRWTPQRTVSVVIPAYDCASTLPLTLAALAAQSYPQELLEVVVVDDGGPVRVSLDGPRPARTRVVPTDARYGWGRAAACQTGADAARGEVIHWLDSDMLPFREHVEAQVRWHEVCDHVVTLGYKSFVDAPLPRVADVTRHVTSGSEELLHGPDVERVPHEWVEQLVDRSDGLATAGWSAFRAHVGATATVGAHMLRAAGGMDPVLKLAEDSELGYRLSNRGAVFVPEPAARSFHLGASHVMRVRDQVIAHNTPYITQRMPLPRFRRSGSGVRWSVPVISVAVEVLDHCQDALLDSVLAVAAGPLRDFELRLRAPWSVLDDSRRSPLRDEHLPLRRLQEYLRADDRFVLVEGDDPFSGLHPAVPFTTTLPRGARFGAAALDRVVDTLVRTDLGLLAATVGGAAASDRCLRVLRVAAVERARRLAGGDPDDSSVATVSGGRWFRGEELDVHAVAPSDG